MAAQSLLPRVSSTVPYRSFRLKDPNFSTLQQRRRQACSTKPDLQVLSSALICTSMTLQPPPVTSFRTKNCRCTSRSLPQKPLKYSTRSSHLRINQTTSFSRKSAYTPPLPSPVETAPQSAPPTKSTPSRLKINDSLLPSALSLTKEKEKFEIESPPSRTFNSFSPLTTSFGSTVTNPILSSENEEKPVESPTSPCKSILKRSTGEMEERLVTAPGASGRIDIPASVCFGQSLSAMSQKGVRFDVERNSLHTYERGGFLVNGEKILRQTRHIFQKNLRYKDNK